MSWTSLPFPPRIAMGILCQPGWESTVVKVIGGKEKRNLPVSQAQHSYDASLAVRDETDYLVVQTHFHSARGMFHTWPLKDPLDYRCEQLSGIIALDGDDSPPTLQLFKRYGLGTFAFDRRITRPKQGSIAIYEAGIPAAEGVDYTIDYNTGQVTFAGAGSLTWSGQFWTVCRYGIKELPALVVNRRGPHGELLVVVDNIPIVEVPE